MVFERPHSLAASLGMGILLSLWTATVRAESPTPEQALRLTPVQQHVDYTRPGKEEVPQCKIRAEKENGITAWVVRDPEGQILRRFADTNGDNVVDLWCYFRDGFEVYRDIDADSNGKADQYRWFNLGGTRWGIDRNEDGQIDAWRVISPPEVAEELVLALKTRNRARFELLLLSPRDLGQLGLGSLQGEGMQKTLTTALSKFTEFAADQEAVTPQTRYIDFGGFRPATIPSGTNGSSKDVTIQDNVSALVETNGQHDQVLLGTLIKVGEAWKLLDLPALGSDGQPPANGFLLASSGGNESGAAAAQSPPSQEMQQLMTELERLDQRAEGLSPNEQGPITEQRAELLMRLADVAPDADLRHQWYEQLVDLLSMTVQSGGYPQGLESLDQLEQKLSESNADRVLVPHIVFQRMSARYVVSLQEPGSNAAEIQQQWLADLEEFIQQYPESEDAAEAMLQLGMYEELSGQSEPALERYKQLVAAFPDSPPAEKAKGAIRRLTSVGKPMQLRGQAVQGGVVDLASYRGQLVLIQYWATWCEPCIEDMQHLKELYQKYGGHGFEIIGVALDESPAGVKQFLAENRLPWKQIDEPGGLDGRLANEMGVMTLPLMILVDAKGNVVDHSIFVPELDAELKRLSEPD